MRTGAFQPVFDVAVLALISYILHKLALHFIWPLAELTFYYSIEALYAMFGFASAAIVLLLIRVRKQNINIVGNTFMLVTCIKMVFAYILLHPVLSSERAYPLVEKFNFLVIFLLFLTIETVVTIRLLNKQ